LHFWFGVVVGLVVGFVLGSFGTAIEDIHEWINSRKDKDL